MGSYADDDGEEVDNNGSGDSAPKIRGEGGGGFHDFNKKQAEGVLYKLNPMSDDVEAQMTDYVHGGAMDKDLRFAREVFGLTNTSGRKEFTTYWESPWVEEHIRDTTKRRKMESQQRAMAARTFIRNSSANESDNVEKFIETVETLHKWEDNYDSRDNVKTVSRLIQSFERIAVRSIVDRLDGDDSMSSYKYIVEAHFRRLSQQSGDIDTTRIAHALRRANAVFDLFALLVAMEISWSDVTSGTRNLTMSLTEQIMKKRSEAINGIIRRIFRLTETQIPVDTVGLPLMGVNYNLCVSKGVLLVGPGSTNATYVLDIKGFVNSVTGSLDLTGVKTIVISKAFSAPSAAAAAAPSSKSKK